MLTFCKMEGLKHQDEIVAMMHRLYEEDPSADPLDTSAFHVTVEHLITCPSAGQIILIFQDCQLRGYAVLIPYWSNEFGGVLLFVDELFVRDGFRNQGIGHRFFDYLEQQRPFGAVALALEVNPNNERAHRLYDSIGFVKRRNATLTRSF